MLSLLLLACGAAPEPLPPLPMAPKPPPLRLAGVTMGAPMDLPEPVCEGALEALEPCREEVEAWGHAGELVVDMGRARFLAEVELGGVLGMLVVELEGGAASDLSFVHGDAAQAAALAAWLTAEGWQEAGGSEASADVTMRYFDRPTGEARLLASSESVGVVLRASTRSVRAR